MLKRNIPERVWIFDIEWVPDANAARRLYDLPQDTPQSAAIERLWAEFGATEERPRPFLKYLLSRIVSIAFLSRRVVYIDAEPQLEFSMQSLPELPADQVESDEASIIERFLYLVGRAKPQLVGYNSHESDVQALIQRALVNEVSAPLFCRRPENKWDADFFGKWDNEEHLDLIKLFSGGRMQPKLNELARLCGFPGKMDIDGDHVVDLWLAGDLTKIIEYNQIDTLNTYLLWLRVVYFCGKLSGEEYAAETEQFRGFLEAEAVKPEREFLRSFLEKWEY